LPRWRKDGRQIFFITLDRELRSVDINPGSSTIEPGASRVLFQTRTPLSTSATYHPYDVSADGQRFLITTTPTEAASSDPITVVLNWTAALNNKK